MMVYTAALAASSLLAVCSSAFSQDLVEAQVTPSGPAQTTQRGEPAKSAELPEAPQVTPINSGGPIFPPAMGPLLPQDFHDKLMAYAFGSVGPRALIAPAIPAALRMAKPLKNYPPAWRQGAEAYGRNYGDQLATVSAFQTGRFIAGAALHEDLRYHPSTSSNFFLRTGHAVAFTFFDKSDSGHTRLALANFSGVAAGSYVGMSYLPPGFNDITHADQRLAVRLGGLAGSNIGAEFAPDIFRFAAKHHLPHVKFPIPDWWTKQ